MPHSESVYSLSTVCSTVSFRFVKKSNPVRVSISSTLLTYSAVTVSSD